jgi:hypothetical protein
MHSLCLIFIYQGPVPLTYYGFVLHGPRSKLVCLFAQASVFVQAKRHELSTAIFNNTGPWCSDITTCLPNYYSYELYQLTIKQLLFWTKLLTNVI